MNKKSHWDTVYQSKGIDEVSWYQSLPEISLALIKSSCIGKGDGVIDVGGGSSGLVGCLLEEGYSKLAVLDLSTVALGFSRERLGKRADKVEWFETDVTQFTPPHRYGLWHDRAVFHFLTERQLRMKYVETIKKTAVPGGSVIIATFATNGPTKCSGLEVVRYDEKSIMAEVGSDFLLQEMTEETHLTPWHSEQHFAYFRFKWIEN